MSKAEGKKISIKFTLPINALALIPTVVVDEAYSTPTGVVTCSYQTTPEVATRAFDGNIDNYWRSSSAPQWIMIELNTPRSVAGFRMYTKFNMYNPNQTKFYGSNDGVNFDLIADTYSANSTGWKVHTFNATQEYKYFKWQVVSTHYPNRVYVYDIQLLFANVSYESGIEDAFTVTGSEFEWLDGPNNNGELVSKTYLVTLVQTHPIESNSILLDVEGFRNVQGNITITYNQALGNLAGTGGAVASFTETFTPTELTKGLTETGGATGTHEYIDANVGGSIDLIYISKLDAFHPAEYVDAMVGGSIQLIHIDDINP